MANRNYIAKINANEHQEFLDLRCHFENCDFVAEKWDEYMEHIENFHVRMNEDGYIRCGFSVKNKICKFAAQTERQMALHRGIRHWNGAVHVCQSCHKGFDQKQSLLNHEFSKVLKNLKFEFSKKIFFAYS